MDNLTWTTVLGWVVAAVAGVWVLVKDVIPLILKSRIDNEKSKLQAQLQDTSDRRDYQQELLKAQLEQAQEQAQRLIDVLVANEDFIRQIIYQKLDNLDARLRTQDVSMGAIRDELGELLSEMKLSRQKLHELNNGTK